ncbi:MAG: hypothetical protein C4536_02600 [Actinobacteria bacterium]|jgi:hypothetical protein|nr:MAG: hypothetical protein C4536_02600 [Actinomycetota bacterium]
MIENGERGDETAPSLRTRFFERLHGEWLEILSAILLALATVASAWGAYQAARWSSEEALRFNEATASRVHAAEADDLADAELDIDVEMFLDYLDAQRAGDDAAVQDYEAGLFRDEMRVAMEAWTAANPTDNPEAPGTPFEMPEYVNANREEGRRLEQEAQAKLNTAKEAIHNSDFYVMLTVLFASVLFFAGICTKFKTPWIRVAVLSTGAVLFVATLIITALQPVM